MALFIEGVELSTEVCCNCGMLFAMPADIQRRRRNDGKNFHCPAGHPQHYTGPTEAQLLQRQLDRQKEMTEAAVARADRVSRERDAAARAHRKIRARIANGVCPCCNRTFQNLLGHMRTQHPEFTKPQTLPALRRAFAMTQEAVASEAGVSTVYVSCYERGKRVPTYAERALDSWIERHAAADAT